MSNLRLSPSGAAMWAQCPRRWWLRYVDRLPEPPPGEPAVIGTFVHRILELLLAEAPEDRTLERARALAAVARAEIEETEDWQALELDDAAGRRFRHRVWQTVQAYFDLMQPQAVRPVAQELQVEVDIDDVPFRGYIDLVEEHTEPAAGDAGAVDQASSDDQRPAVVITDYKTGRPPELGKPWSDARVDEKLLQPLWYAAAVRELAEHRPVRARLLYFSAVPGRRDDQGFRWYTQELATDVTEERLGAAVTELRARWAAIQAALDEGTAPATVGPLCGWCPYIEHCPEGQAECQRRWNERNEYTGGRRLREDAPAVAVLGLV